MYVLSALLCAYAGFAAPGQSDQAGDPALDALIEKGRYERDTEKLRGVVHEIQRQRVGFLVVAAGRRLARLLRPPLDDVRSVLVRHGYTPSDSNRVSPASHS